MRKIPVYKLDICTNVVNVCFPSKLLVHVNTYKFDACHFLSYNVINSKKYCQKQLFLFRSKNHKLVFVCLFVFFQITDSLFAFSQVATR